MNPEEFDTLFQTEQQTDQPTAATRLERMAAAYKWSCHFPGLIERSFGQDVDRMLCRHLVREMAEWLTPAEYEAIAKDVGRYTKILPFIEREHFVQKTFFDELISLMPNCHWEVVSRADCAAIIAKCHTGFVAPGRSPEVLF